VFPMARRAWNSSRWLALPRAAWLLLALYMLVATVVSVPIAFKEMQIVCDGASPCADSPNLTADVARSLEDAGISLATYAGVFVATRLIIFLTSWLVALLIFLAKPGEPLGLFMAIFLLAYGGSFGSTPDMIIAGLPAFVPWLIAGLGLISVQWGFTAFALFLYLFPDGHFVPRWTRYLVPLALLLDLNTMLTSNYIFLQREAFSMGLPNNLVTALHIVVVPLGLAAQLYRYLKVSDLQQRQKTKWVVYGGLLAVFVLVAVVMLTLLIEGSQTTIELLAPEVVPLVFVLFPLSLGVAILRSQLWDIDVIIRKTVVYGVLTILLTLAYLGSVVVIQGLFTAVSGQRSPVALVVSTLLIAALFAPLRQKVRDVIDHRFYRRKYDATRTLAAFARTARDEVDLETLTAELLKVVQETVQPANLSIWLRQSEKAKAGQEAVE
jgi:hypothetical protein